MARKRQRKGSRRRPTKQDDMFVTKLAQRRVNPPAVRNDLVCQHKGEVVVSWTATSLPAAGTLSVATLLSTIPGTDVVWDVVQFRRFDVWGGFNLTTATTGVEPVGGALPIEVTLNQLGTSTFTSDLPTFFADGVGTGRRAHIGIVPNGLYQRNWVSTAATEAVLTISTEPYAFTTPNYSFEVLVQYTCVLRSTAGTTGPTVAAEATSKDRFTDRSALADK